MKIVWQTVIKENYWRDLESERVKGQKSKYNRVNCNKNKKNILRVHLTRNTRDRGENQNLACRRGVGWVEWED